jgi:hypothetical protein
MGYSAAMARSGALGGLGDLNYPTTMDYGGGKYPTPLVLGNPSMRLASQLARGLSPDPNFNLQVTDVMRQLVSSPGSPYAGIAMGDPTKLLSLTTGLTENVLAQWLNSGTEASRVVMQYMQAKQPIPEPVLQQAIAEIQQIGAGYTGAGLGQ